MNPASWITTLSWRKDLHNSVKLWAMLCRATQDRQVIVKNPDNTWSTGGENGNPLQYSCNENPQEQYEKAKRYDTRKWVPAAIPPPHQQVQIATGKNIGDTGQLANSRWWWRTEEPGMLQSKALRRVGNDLATEHHLPCIFSTTLFVHLTF